MPSFAFLHQPFSFPQSWARMVIVLCCLIGVVACGKRPPDVAPPVGGESVTYPRTYPDPMEAR